MSKKDKKIMVSKPPAPIEGIQQALTAKTNADYLGNLGFTQKKKTMKKTSKKEPSGIVNGLMKEDDLILAQNLVQRLSNNIIKDKTGNI